MPDDDFYNTIGAFRVASDRPRGYFPRRHLTTPSAPQPHDTNEAHVVADDTTFLFHEDGSFELRDAPIDSGHDC